MDKKIENATETTQNLWKEIMNKKRSESMIVPTLKDEYDNIYYTNNERANLIARNLQITNQTEEPDDWTIEVQILIINNTLNNQQNEQTRNIQITPRKIIKLIQEPRPYKAPGEDGIQNKHHKNFQRK